jgi:hypothetical protein
VQLAPSVGASVELGGISGICLPFVAGFDMVYNLK